MTPKGSPMNQTCQRRTVLAIAAALAAASIGGFANAQPAKSVKLIVPFPAGGTADMLPRILVEKVRGAYPAGDRVIERSVRRAVAQNVRWPAVAGHPPTRPR